MSGSEPTIEAEVVEIDGVAVETVPVRGESVQDAPWVRWGALQGGVKRLDMRWWPLWVVLGFFALVVIVAVGLVAAVVIVTFRIIAWLLGGIANLIFPSQALQKR